VGILRGWAGDFAYLVEDERLEIFTNVTDDTTAIFALGKGAMVCEMVLIDNISRLATTMIHRHFGAACDPKKGICAKLEN